MPWRPQASRADDRAVQPAKPRRPYLMRGNAFTEKLGIFPPFAIPDGSVEAPDGPILRIFLSMALARRTVCRGKIDFSYSGRHWTVKGAWDYRRTRRGNPT